MVVPPLCVGWIRLIQKFRVNIHFPDENIIANHLAFLCSALANQKRTWYIDSRLFRTTISLFIEYHTLVLSVRLGVNQLLITLPLYLHLSYPAKLE